MSSSGRPSTDRFSNPTYPLARPMVPRKPDGASVSLLCMAMASGAVGGDVAGFEQAVRTESRRLYGLAISILGNQQEADDAVQDTMELAWKSWGSLRDPLRRSDWLKQICVRRCLRIRRGFLSSFLLSDRDPDPRRVASSDPDVDRVFRNLSPHQRAVVALHYEYGYPLDECAVLMQCRPGTARSHLARALGRFRKELADE
jgi:RNA polymerase sigma-70 factor (ECF subfamily)